MSEVLLDHQKSLHNLKKSFGHQRVKWIFLSREYCRCNFQKQQRKTLYGLGSQNGKGKRTLTVHLGGAMNCGIGGVRVVDEVHPILFTVQGPLMPASL